MNKGKILLIEDNHVTFTIVKRLLTDIGYGTDDIVRCTLLSELSQVDKNSVDVVLTDLSLADSPYDVTFSKVHKHFPYTPIIVLTGTNELELALETIKQGAQDYLLKGEFDRKMLDKSIQYAIERKRIANDYKRLFEENPMPMYIYDNETYRFLAVNKAALHQYGYTREVFLSMHATDIRPAEDLPAFYGLNKEVADGNFDAGIWKHLNSKGEIFFVHIYVHKSEFEGKTAKVVTAINIDKQVRTEKELQEKGSEMAQVLESITDGFYTLNAQWEFTYVNRETERRLKSTREELLGKCFWDLFPMKKHTKFHSEYTRAVADNVSVHFEEYYLPLNMWVSVNAYPSKNGLAVYFVDITEQKNNRDQIFNDAQKLRAIINNTEDIIWSVDRNYKLIDANQSYWSRVSDIVGKPVNEVTEEDIDIGKFEDWKILYDRALNGDTYKMVMFKNYSGKEVYEEVSFNPICDKNGEIIAVSCFARDITEQRTYLARIEQQNERLSQIAWIHSHEVRSPVANIMGLAQLFNFHDEGDPINRDVIKKLREVAMQLDEAIRKSAAYTHNQSL